MKHLILFVSICALWSLSSCGGGDGTRESCVGPYAGTFEVTIEGTPVEGRFLGYLGPRELNDPPDVLVILPTIDTETTKTLDERIRATVTEDGAVAGTGIMGNFDFDACEASGILAAGDILTDGAWRLSTGHSAF